MVMVDLTALHHAYDTASFDLRVSLVKFAAFVELGQSVPTAILDEYYERCTRLQSIVEAMKQAERVMEHMEIVKE